MAVVFLATDTRTNRHVALRSVPHYSGQDVLDAEHRGAELQKQFCQVSSFVPEVYDHGSEAGYFYVAMEYLEGENLSQVIRRGPMPAPRAVAIAIELCRFLEDSRGFAWHEGGRDFRHLLHGDLTPVNVRHHGGRPGQGARLRHRESAVDEPEGDAQRFRQPRVPVARTHRERRRDGRHRRLLGGGRHALRDAARRAAVQRARYAPPRTRDRRPPAGAAAHGPLSRRACRRSWRSCSVRRPPIGIRVPRRSARISNGFRPVSTPSRCRRDGPRASPTSPRRGGWSRRTERLQEATRRTVPPPLPVILARLVGVGDDRAVSVRPVTPSPAPPPIPAPLRLVPSRGRRRSRSRCRRCPRPGAPRPARRRRAPSRDDRYLLGVSQPARIVLAVLLVLLVGNEIMVGRAAGRIAERGAVTGSRVARRRWGDYQRLSARSVGPATWRLERMLKRRTTALTDRVIASYREGLSVVWSAQWTEARAGAGARRGRRSRLVHAERRAALLRWPPAPDQRRRVQAQQESGCRAPRVRRGHHRVPRGCGTARRLARSVHRPRPYVRGRTR